MTSIVGILPSRDLLLLQHAKAPLLIMGEEVGSQRREIVILKPNPEEIFVYYPQERRVILFDKLVYQGGATILIKKIVVPRDSWEFLDYANYFYAPKKAINKPIIVKWGFPLKDEQANPVIARVTIPVSLVAKENNVKYLLKTAISGLHNTVRLTALEMLVGLPREGKIPLIVNGEYCEDFEPEMVRHALEDLLRSFQSKGYTFTVEKAEFRKCPAEESAPQGKLNVIFKIEEDGTIRENFEQKLASKKLDELIDKDKLLEEVNSLLAQLGDVSDLTVRGDEAEEDFSEMEFFGRTLFERANAIIARKNLHSKFQLSGAAVLDSSEGQYVVVMGEFNGAYQEFIDKVLKDALIEMLQKWGSKLSNVKKVVFVGGGEE